MAKRPSVDRDHVISVFCVLGLLGALALLAGLLTQCAAPRPACGPERLAEIEGLYLAEVLALCKGESFDACKARPEIERRHKAYREEWAQCR